MQKVRNLLCVILSVIIIAAVFSSCSGAKNGEDLSTRTIISFNATVKEVLPSALMLEVSADVKNGDTVVLKQGDEVSAGYSDTSQFKAGNLVAVAFDGIVRETYPLQITASSVVKLLDKDSQAESATGDENYVQTSGVLSEKAPKLRFLKNDDSSVKYDACQNAVRYSGEDIEGENALMTTGYGYARKTDDFKFVTLVFDVQPDSYSVRAWGESSIGNSSDSLKGETVESDNNVITFKDDLTVYEVTAKWNNGDRIVYSLYVGEAG